MADGRVEAQVGTGGYSPPVWEAVAVPGPEPDWGPAPHYYSNLNPALQYGMWESAVLGYRAIGVLPPPLEPYADRLVLEVEHSWEDLGRVDVATFRLQKCIFALSQFAEAPEKGVTIWLDRRASDDEAALAVLLEALGIGLECVKDTAYSPHRAAHHLNPPVSPPAEAASPAKPASFLARALRAIRRSRG